MFESQTNSVSDGIPTLASKTMSNSGTSEGTKFKFGTSNVSFSTLREKEGSFSELLGASNEAPQKAGDGPDANIQARTKGASEMSLEQKSSVTGEENEDQIFACHAKLYEFDKTSARWNDHGAVIVKVNEFSDGSEKYRRLLVRSDPVLKVILNIRVDDLINPELRNEREILFSDVTKSMKPCLLRFRNRTDAMDLIFLLHQ